ncbi:shikimate dehydrogenase [Anaerovirgula multivorans]|uniref:Shikimate dehydrogenase (NADP(+)) n=1 Tax=Anaerovirgula multivorans TaxID=312168 RepID=A0A239HIN7_9FIRM|nr:shikimate dehydrogenase [Anaerovirgula multivorans]SNS81180.1 shikimate dehydrogenase [Anaerovirgula multivorans]
MSYAITDETRLTGIIGTPIKQSFSPKIHNKAFGHLNLNYLYIPFDVQQQSLGKTVEAMKTLNFRGFNVTMPHKQEIMKHLDGISEEAKIIGAVNTVVNQQGNLIGYNTDGKGYTRSLKEEGVAINNKTFVIAGAGGAARSVAIQLALDGAKKIILLNRTLQKAHDIAELITKNISDAIIEVNTLENKNLVKALEEADVLVNSTPLGMYSAKDQSIIEDEEIIPAGLVVSDLIYNPAKTKLLQQAENRKCQTVNGLGMLIWQAAIAFELWTQVPMPVDYVKNAILRD